MVVSVPNKNTCLSGIDTKLKRETVGAEEITAAGVPVPTAVSQYGYGWGTYEWGKEAWGTPRSTSNVTIEGRDWSFDNFGEDLLATVNNGNTFRWDTSVGTGTPCLLYTSPSPRD